MALGDDQAVPLRPMLAAQRKLEHLIVFVDDNGCQVDGFTGDILNMRPFDQKYRAFGWHAMSIPGTFLMSQWLGRVVPLALRVSSSLGSK